VFGATMQWNVDRLVDPDRLAFLTVMRANASRSSVLDETDADTQSGVMAPPRTYATPYVDITDPVIKKFGSGVQRDYANSNRPLRLFESVLPAEIASPDAGAPSRQIDRIGGNP
jgi:hypothetical protein